MRETRGSSFCASGQVGPRRRGMLRRPVSAKLTPMATPSPADAPKLAKPRWYAPTPAKFLFAVLVMQGLLFASSYCRWLPLLHKGHAVLLTVAATSVSLLLMLTWFYAKRLAGRTPQYSLVALMLLVPVVAFPCAWLMKCINQARQQRRFEEMASGLMFDVEDLAENWFTEILGMEFFRDIEMLNVSNSSLCDGDIADLQTLPRLRGLLISGTQITDTGLKQIARLTQLESLFLDRTRVTNAGLAELRQLSRVRHLSLSETQVTDAGLAHIKGLTNLRVLNVCETQVTDTGLMYLEGLTKMEDLRLADTRVTDVGMLRLNGLSELRTLHLDRTGVTGAGLKSLNGLTKLQWLKVSETHVTDVDMIHVGKFAQMEWLSLDKTLVTDAGLVHLEGLTKLERLNLLETNVTKAGTAKLKVAVPRAYIWASRPVER
jgi:hypothetical protein